MDEGKLITHLAGLVREVPDAVQGERWFADYDGEGGGAVAVFEEVEPLPKSPSRRRAVVEELEDSKAVAKRAFSVAGAMLDSKFRLRMVHRGAIWELRTIRGMANARKAAANAPEDDKAEEITLLLRQIADAFEKQGVEPPTKTAMRDMRSEINRLSGSVLSLAGRIDRLPR